MNQIRIRSLASVRAAAVCLAALLVLPLAATTAWGREGEPGGGGSARVPAASVQGSRWVREAAGLPSSASSSGWWFGTAGVAAILALCGVVCLGVRTRWPVGQAGGMRIVGRMSLSPRHSIVLVEAGSKTLIVGLGPQAAPALLGEVPVSAAAGTAVEPGSRWPVVDVRLGDDA